MLFGQEKNKSKGNDQSLRPRGFTPAFGRAVAFGLVYFRRASPTLNPTGKREGRCSTLFRAKLTYNTMILPKLLLLLVLTTPLDHAQTSTPTFEVATIRVTGPSDGHTHINYPPGDRFSATNITLLALMQWAYSMPEKQILEGPSWLASSRFDFQAKTDTDQIKGLTSEQDRDLKRRMVQALVAERFQLKLHQETRILPAYDLVLAKGGSKLQPTG